MAKSASVVFCVVVAALALLLCLAEAKVVEQRVKHHANKLLFLTKFCFASEGENGTATFDVLQVTNTTDLQFLLFDDDVWSKVYDKDLSCAQIRDTVTSNPKSAGMVHIIPGMHRVLHFRDRTRPRWWYFAASQCSEEKMDFKYKLEFRNPGNWWHKQFSFDQQGLVIIFLVYWIFYFLINIFNAKRLHSMWKAGRTTTVFKVFVALMVLEFVAKFSLFIHEAVYADDGIGVPGFQGFGEIIDMCASLLLMGLLILMAKGWSITTKQIKHRPLLVGVLSVFFISYIGFFIWENLESDEVTTNNSYESVPGIINHTLRTLIWLFFCLCIFMTIMWDNRPFSSFDDSKEKDEVMETAASDYSRRQKLLFFTGFGVLGSIWFLSEPFIVIVMTGFESYYRLKVTIAFSLTINFLIEMALGAWLYKSQGGIDFVWGDRTHAREEPSTSSTREGQKILELSDQRLESRENRQFVSSGSMYDSL